MTSIKLNTLRALLTALRLYVILLIAIETGDGALQLAALQAIAPIFPVSGRRNYTVMTAHLLLELLGPRADGTLRHLWEQFPGGRLFVGGAVHGFDALNEMQVRLIKSSLVRSGLSKNAFLHHCATYQQNDEIVQNLKAYVLSSRERHQRPADTDDQLARLGAAVDHLRALVEAKVDIIPVVSDHSKMNKLVNAYSYGVRLMMKKIVAASSTPASAASGKRTLDLSEREHQDSSAKRVRKPASARKPPVVPRSVPTHGHHTRSKPLQ